MFIPKIAIVGAGQLGSRHLQGIALIDQPSCVYVVDPSQSSLVLAKQRFIEANDGSEPNEVHFINDISSLPSELDVVIIATNSLVRREVIETLVCHHSIRYMILEKFLFPTVKDYYDVGELLRNKNIQVWVNCPRRLWRSYQHIKKLMDKASHVNFAVSGSNIGLGSNAIHFLDIFSYLTDTNPEQIDLSEQFLDHNVIASKREGYVEFTGTIYGKTKQGNLFSVTSFSEQGAPLTVLIDSDKARLIIREFEQKCILSKLDENWKWIEDDFEVEYQSMLTDKVIVSLLNNGTCSLPTFVESSNLHVHILRTFLKHMSRLQGRDVKECRIT